MNETSEYGLNIDLDEQKRILQSLNNKYNIKSKKLSDDNTSDKKGQDYLTTNSTGICRTNSSNSNASTSSQNSQTQKQTRKTNKNKSVYENVCINLDFELLKTYGQEILNELDVLDIKYELKNQISRNLITWKYLDDEPDTQIESDFETVLLILNWDDVVNYVSSNKLLGHIESISKTLSKKRIVLGLYGFENYFKYWKSQKQAQRQGKSNDKLFNDYKNSVKISRHELEYVLTELEIRYMCCHRFLENVQDIVDMISQFTKSISQLPEKLQKKQKYKNIDFCVVKDARDCVAVDKNGNGFRRLWQQQLTTFDLVGLETAEAILSKYGTPAQLFKAYDDCTSKDEGIKLIEDIPIRRAAGPLTTTRRVGPEFSGKLYNYFNARDGNIVI